jgi:hypothetical protein
MTLETSTPDLASSNLFILAAPLQKTRAAPRFGVPQNSPKAKANKNRVQAMRLQA